MTEEKTKLLKIKKRMQEARNIVNNMRGIKVICLYEPDEGKIGMIDFRGMGVYGGFKKPEMVIDLAISKQELSEIIKTKTGLENGQTIYLLLQNGIWAKTVIWDVDLLVDELWPNQIAFIDEKMKKMYEFGNDSRDEYHYLYDEYEIVFRV